MIVIHKFLLCVWIHNIKNLIVAVGNCKFWVSQQAAKALLRLEIVFQTLRNKHITVVFRNGLGITNLEARQNYLFFFSSLNPKQTCIVPKLLNRRNGAHSQNFTKILVFFLVPVHAGLSKQSLRFVYPPSWQFQTWRTQALTDNGNKLRLTSYSLKQE